MDLVEFHNRIYARFQNNLYVMEPTWDSFRPIEKLGWNGTQFEIDDYIYKQNIFSEFYGFESLEQKHMCHKLLQETELGNARLLNDPIEFWRWCREQNVKWWNDRPVVFTNSCVPRDNRGWKSYLKYLNKKPKTLRRSFKGKATRRLLPE
jgi:hypothetical protein